MIQFRFGKYCKTLVMVFLNLNRILGLIKYFELGSSDFCRIILNR